MTVEIRRASQGFTTRTEGRHTRHSFSFGTHYDPENVGFGPLVCHDDHLLAAGAGFSGHPHGDLEIVTWVLRGTLLHADDRTDGGRDARLAPGIAQVLSAGSGLVHSEVAAPDAGAVRFVQAWLTPDVTGTTPARASAEVDLPHGVLVPVASGHDPAAALRLGTRAATFWVARLEAGDRVTLPDDPLQHVYLARGALTRSSLAEPLSEGDAFRITDQPGLAVAAGVSSELLVWSFRD